MRHVLHSKLQRTRWLVRFSLEKKWKKMIYEDFIDQWAPLNWYWLQLEFYWSIIPWWKASEPEGKQSSQQESTQLLLLGKIVTYSPSTMGLQTWRWQICKRGTWINLLSAEKWGDSWYANAVLFCCLPVVSILPPCKWSNSGKSMTWSFMIINYFLLLWW